MNEFALFISNITAYPTAIFTGMVMFVTLYWLVSLLGMADMDTFEIGDVGADIGDLGGSDVGDLGSDVGGDASIGFFSGILLRFGLYGVPLVVILTLISLIGWVLSYLYSSFLNQHFPSGVLHYVFGTGAFIVVMVIAMWITGLLIAPVRKRLEKIPKRDSKSFIGQVAIVRTFTVDESHGEASLEDGGAGLIFKVRAMEGKRFKQDDRVVLFEYIAEENAYRVVGESEYLG